VIVTLDVAVTALVFTVKYAMVAPDGIVTLAGTAARVGSELVSVAVNPPAGAGPSRVTRLEVVAVPPLVLVGLTVTPVTAASFTVTFAVFVLAPYVAVIVTVLAALTAYVVIVK